MMSVISLCVSVVVKQFSIMLVFIEKEHTEKQKMISLKKKTHHTKIFSFWPLISGFAPAS